MSLSTAAAALWLVAATVFYAVYCNDHYPLGEWLFFYYLRCWLYTAVFLIASLAAGWRMLHFVLPGSLPWADKVVLGSALGVLTFFVGMFLGGLFHAFGPVFFVVLPLLLLAFGGRSLAGDVLAWRGLDRLGVQRWLPGTPSELLCGLFLLIGVVAVYLQVMLPTNLAADSYWYHLPAAEFYVQAGGIERFPEGWYVGTYPQLATMVYTWAFLAPGGLFEHVLLCLHLEFGLFLVTLAGISLLAGRLLRQHRLRFGAAAIFLFPILFVYDSNLNAGADHILAFWAPALALALIRLGSDFRTREAVLAGLLAGGALLTKYQGIFLVAPAALLVLVLALRARRLGPALVWSLTCLMITAPHWLKNLVYYHDPMYPVLYRYFPSRPFHRGADKLLKNIFWSQQFMLHGSFQERVVSTVKALVTFSFVPNGWAFHGKRPLFGSLFTLIIPLLAFLRASLRTWLVVIGVHIGIVIWYAIQHEDRYLQALLPWMAAVTAAGLALAWRRRGVARAAAGLLVLFQVVWGADAYFTRTHAIAGDSPIRALGEYLAASHSGRYRQRYRIAPTFEEVSRHLPKGARLLVHGYNSRLGLAVRFLEDQPGRQGGIEYLDMTSPAAVVSLWRSYGVTHVLWRNRRDSMSPDALARETVFVRAVAQYLGASRSIESWQLAPLNDRPKNEDLATSPTRLALLGCEAEDQGVLYTPRGMESGTPERRFIGEHAEPQLVDALDGVNAILVRKRCGPRESVRSVLDSSFSPEAWTDDIELWARRSPAKG
ncbi:MAG: glycosyltransferase family 39 protein [Deltaproteobacteria bacterium]|nr:glycosyltransferase family 39 protein [Deltaproteobacteria bacterium]